MISVTSVAKKVFIHNLKAAGLKRGLLINFGEQKLVKGIKRFSL